MEVAGENLVAAVRDWQLDDLKLAYVKRASIAVRTMAGANAHAIQLGARIEILKRSLDGEVRAFAVVKLPGEGSAECWVHIDETKYGELFYFFLTTYHDFPLQTRLPRSVQIDHLLSRHMARAAGMNYVRLAPITQRGNSHSGSREFQFVNNASSLPPYDPKNVFGLTEEEWNTPAEVHHEPDDLSCRPLWGPSLVKLLPVFYPPPTGTMPAIAVIEVLRALREQCLLPDDDLNMPFGLVLSAYRLYATGIPDYSGWARVFARAKDSSGNTLEHHDTVATWLAAQDLIPLEDAAYAGSGGPGFD